MDEQGRRVTFWRIKDWRTHFENNRTRDLKRMAWVPIPNKMDGDGYAELLDHPNGAAHFGVWVAIVEIASRGLPPSNPAGGCGNPAGGCGNPAGGCKCPAEPCRERGNLVREGGRPHDILSLSRLSRIPVNLFQETLPRLIQIGWIEEIQIATSTKQEGAGIPQEGAGIPHESAGIPQEGVFLTRVRGTERNGTERNKEQHTHIEETSGVVGKPNGNVRVRAADLEGQTSSRFEEFWEKYPLQVEKDDACHQFVSFVTATNEAEVFACLDRYLASDQVNRGVVSKAGVWLQKQHRDKWKGKWPLPKNGSPPEPPKLTICPSCNLKPCVCFERHRERERQKQRSQVNGSAKI